MSKVKKIGKAKIFFHRGVTIKEARSIVNKYDHLQIEYSGNDGYQVFVVACGLESIIRSLLLNAKIKSVVSHVEGPTKKPDMIRNLIKDKKCKFCGEIGYCWIGNTLAKFSYHCRKCDCFWTEYKVFDSNWEDKEVSVVRSYITVADEWRWYKGKNIFSAWRKGDKNTGVITAKNLSSLVEKVAESIINEKNIETLHNMF
jgi:hypothetical protein